MQENHAKHRQNLRKPLLQRSKKPYDFNGFRVLHGRLILFAFTTVYLALSGYMLWLGMLFLALSILALKWSISGSGKILAIRATISLSALLILLPFSAYLILPEPYPDEGTIYALSAFAIMMVGVIVVFVVLLAPFILAQFVRFAIFVLEPLFKQIGEHPKGFLLVSAVASAAVGVLKALQ